MIEQLLKVVGEVFPLHETQVGEFSRMKVAGLNYTVRRFEVEGLGILSLMQAKGFFGLMKMDIFMIIPFQRDQPFLSCDRIQALGKDTCLFEVYDTPADETHHQDLSPLDAVKETYAHLPAMKSGTYWYENIRLPQSVYKKGRGITPQLDEMSIAYVKAYLASTKTAPVCDVNAKREKTLAYVDGLLTHGGPATDIFVKEIGREKTEELFKTVLFL